MNGCRSRSCSEAAKAVEKAVKEEKAAKERRGAMEDNKADLTAPAAEAAQERRESRSKGSARRRPKGFGYRKD
jgi:hypothetical protein